MKNTLYKIFILILSVGLLSMSIHIDLDDPRIVKIRDQFNKFFTDCHQEKVYIQCDRAAYKVGEIIWYKAYIFSGIHNYPDTANKNLYIELVNSDNQVYISKLLRIRYGISYGDFSIPDTFPPGNYYIRAYTNWMRNFDDAYLFTKKIQIWNDNPQKWLTYNKLHDNRRFNRKLKRQLNNVDLSFFPEGGNMVSGIESRLAFKAVDNWGKGIDVEGQIVDNKKQQVAKFKSTHLGIGALNFKPENGKTYYAILSKPDRIKQKFHLPLFLADGVVMSINQDNKFVNINIQSKLPPSNDEYAYDFILLVQSNGKICQITNGNLRENLIKSQIPVVNLPDGISHFTLFDGRGNPICERLVFINNHRQLNVKINSDKKIYAPREKVTMAVHVTNNIGQPVMANLSLAVTDLSKNNDTAYYTENILSYVLMSSDLRGTIEQPAWYFKNESEDTRSALDNLLLTQGWRRFVWKNILAGRFPVLDHKVEKSITINGQITRDLLSIPYPDSKVTLFILSSYNDIFETYTDKKGKFSFTNLFYPDTVSVRIEAVKSSGRKNLVISVDQNDPPGKSNIYSSEMRVAKMKSKYLKNQKYYNEKRKPEDEISPPMYGEADNVIYVDPNEIAGYSDIIQYIQGRVAGVDASNDRVIIRGISTIYGSTDPLFLIDEIQVDANTAKSVNLFDVQRIEILKGPRAAFFGSQGSNGVIAIFTRKGFNIVRALSFKMLGYYTAREFYAPKYEAKEDSLHIPDYRSTIYWNPLVETDKDGNASVSFYNSDAVTTFSTRIEGISYKGQVGSCEQIYNTVK